MAELTLASEDSGSLAKLQLILQLLHLQACFHWGCRMSENRKGGLHTPMNTLKIGPLSLFRMKVLQWILLCPKYTHQLMLQYCNIWKSRQQHVNNASGSVRVHGHKKINENSGCYVRVKAFNQFSWIELTLCHVKYFRKCLPWECKLGVIGGRLFTHSGHMSKICQNYGLSVHFLRSRIEMNGFTHSSCMLKTLIHLKSSS